MPIAVGSSSTTDPLALDLHGYAIEFDPVNSKVLFTKGSKSRSINVFNFTRWEIMEVEPDVGDPQYVRVNIGNTDFEFWALYPGVARFTNPSNLLIFTESVPADATSSADADPHELADDDWWLLATGTWTLTSGQLTFDSGMASIIYETDTNTRDWKQHLLRCNEEELRIRPKFALQMAQVFWLAWWKETLRGNESLRKQTSFHTMSGETLRQWARELGIQSPSTVSDDRLRLRVKGRILKRHGIIQPERVIRAVRAMIGTNQAGGITVTDNVDSLGAWQTRFVRVSIDATLFESVGYDVAEYSDILADIKESLEEAVAACVRVEVELIGGGVYDTAVWDGAVFGGA